MELKYNAGSNTPYNGNISQLLYTGLNSGSKTFSYGYDKLNRLTTAASTGGMLDESLSYDRMGNIAQLVRGNAGTLNYTSYTGNQLNTVTGYSPRSYAYDANGNATSDGISKAIYYNRLNLPRVVGSVATYTYDAAGQKLRNLGTDGSWDYISGSVYHNGAIAFVSTEEGRAEHKDDGSYNYEYNLKDHLGNSRVSMDYNPSNNTARVLQEDEYYSFGLRKGLYDLSNNNRYLYNGKEVQTDLANQYDYGARFYDPVIARWNTIDPLAERHTDLTPYNYVMNNPLMYGDELGMDTTKVHELKEVKVTATKIKKDNNEDAVGTNLYHRSYHPAPLPPCNCPLFKQAATFTAINLGLAALGEYVSKLKFLRFEATELTQEVKNIGPQKWIKIMNASHAWNKVAVSQGDIEGIISKTLQSGAEMPYGNTGLMSNVMYNNGEVIQVVKAQVNGQTVISNAWVITDPAYKAQALRAIMADLH